MNCAEYATYGTVELARNAFKAMEGVNAVLLANHGLLAGAKTLDMAYNITEDHAQFHPQGRDNGYILDFDGFRVYVSGDTEDIDEMAGFGPLDVAFLSANQPYTMTASQCVDAAMALHPKVLIPYHLSNTDVQEIKNVLDANDSGIRVLLFEELR